MTPHQALHQYAKHNDAEAFRLLVDQYQRLVYSAAARRLLHPHDIEDTVQLTFLKLAKAAATIRKDLAAWLYSTALNNANDLIRRDATRRRHEALAATPECITPDEQQNHWHTLSNRLDEALLQLPPDQQSLIIEHFFRGRTHAQLAADLHRSERTILRHMKSAVAALRLSLNSLGQRPTDPQLTSTLTSLPHPPVPAPLTTQLTKIGLAGTPTTPPKSPLTAITNFASSHRATKLTLAIAATLLTTASLIRYFKSTLPPTTPAAAPPPAATQATPSGPTPPNQPSTIVNIEFQGTADGPKLIPLLKTNIGQPYSRANLEADLATLAALDRFKSVQAQLSSETRSGRTGTAVRFIVEEKSATARPVLPLPAAPIAEGDLLQISVYELVTPRQYYITQTDVRTKPTTNLRGSITLPTLGEIEATGLTPTQLEDRIAKLAIDKGFVLPKSARNPGPTVQVIPIQRDANGQLPVIAPPPPPTPTAAPAQLPTPTPQTQPNPAAQRPTPFENTPILSVEINLTPEELATLSDKLQLRPGQPFTTKSMKADEATLAAANLPVAVMNAVPSPEGLNIKIRLTRPTPAPPLNIPPLPKPPAN